MSKTTSNAEQTGGGPNITRRRALQLGTAGAAAASMPMVYSREAQAIVPVVAAAYLGYAAVGVATVGLAAAGGYAIASWSDPDADDAEALHQQLYGTAIIEGADYNATITDAINRIPSITAAAQDEAIYQAAKVQQAGGTEAEATTAAVDGVNEVFSQVAKDIFVGQDLAMEWYSLAAYNAQQAGLNDALRVKSGANASVTGNTIDLASFDHKIYSNLQLWNGEDLELLTEVDVGDGSVARINWRPDLNTGDANSVYSKAGIQDPAATTVTADDIQWMTDADKVRAAYEELDAQRQTVVNDVATTVSNVFTNAQLDGSGFDITKYLSPAQLAARVATEWGVSNSVAWQLANAAFYGYSLSDVGVTVEATYTPYGGSAQSVKGTLFGELPTDTISVGDTISNVDGSGVKQYPLWFANINESTEKVEILDLEGDLVIDALTDAEGVSITTMDTWSYDYSAIEGTSLDLQALREELQQAFELFEAAKNNNNGGSAFSGGGAIALVVAILAGAAALASGGGSDRPR